VKDEDEVADVRTGAAGREELEDSLLPSPEVIEESMGVTVNPLGLAAPLISLPLLLVDGVLTLELAALVGVLEALLET